MGKWEEGRRRGPLAGSPARVVRRLAAHVEVLDLHAEQRPVGTHAQLVALRAGVEVHVARRAGDARCVEHDRSVQDDAVLLQGAKNPSAGGWGETFILKKKKSMTYGPQLDAPPHLELHGAAHDVDALVPSDDGLAVPFDVQVGRGAAGDLESEGGVRRRRHLGG